MQPIYHFGGDGSLIHVALANGFPPETYKPLIDPLTEQYRAVCLPPRALWPDETPPEKFINWKKEVAPDLLAGIHDHDLDNIIGIGHSFGGIATLIAAINEPERFKAIILLDPTILPVWVMRGLAFARLIGLGRLNPLAKRAQKRRMNFDNIDDAFAYFRPKRLFSDWSDDMIWLYSGTLAPSSNGHKLTLAWPREWEAYYFRTLYTGTWGDLPQLSPDIPLLVIRGGISDTLLPNAMKKMQRIMPQMDVAEIPGHGHLFPQSAPDETRQVIEDWLQKLVP
jgi:pimeloyl-ACP methyl ester carboxylesterase